MSYKSFRGIKTIIKVFNNQICVASIIKVVFGIRFGCLCFCNRRPSHKASDASLVVIRFNSFILTLAYLSLDGLVAYWSRLGKETPRGWFVCVRFIRDNTQEGVCWLSVWYYQTREGAYLLFGLSSTTLQECRVMPCFGLTARHHMGVCYLLAGSSPLLGCVC